eukprot:61732-Chlamydomonas_euryale.AAC.2
MPRGEHADCLLAQRPSAMCRGAQEGGSPSKQVLCRRHPLCRCQHGEIKAPPTTYTTQQAP